MVIFLFAAAENSVYFFKKLFVRGFKIKDVCAFVLHIVHNAVCAFGKLVTAFVKEPAGTCLFYGDSAAVPDDSVFTAACIYIQGNDIFISYLKLVEASVSGVSAFKCKNAVKFGNMVKVRCICCIKRCDRYRKSLARYIRVDLGGVV